MWAFYFLPQNIHVNHPSISDKYFYFFDKYTCQKEKEVLQWFQLKEGEVFLWEPCGLFLSLFCL